MTGGPIPEDVAAFVVRTFRTVVDLEALLLLRGEAPVAWTAQTVAARLYVSADEAARVLAYLEARGLVRADQGTVRYAPVAADDDALVGRLATLYARHLIPVTMLIHARPASRIREFADAFRLKKGT